MTRLRLASLVALSLGAVALTGCAAEQPAAEPTRSAPAPSESATVTSPAPSPTFEVPPTLPGEIARAVHLADGGPDGTPQTSYISSDLVQADVPFAVAGECIGDSVDFEVVRAAVGDSGGVLVAGTIECGVPNSHGAFSTPFSGPVQLILKSTDDITAAWVVVVPG